MLASLIKNALLLAAVGEVLYLLWVLHRKGALRAALTNPRLLPWAGLTVAAFAVGLWYARRIDLVTEGALPRETLEPARLGLGISMVLCTIAAAIAIWRGVGIVQRTTGVDTSSAPAPDA